MVVGGDTEEVKTDVEDTARRIGRWLNRKGLKLAPHKTEAVVLKGSRRMRNLTVNIGGKEIRNQKAIKYLGVYIGSERNMGTHIRQTAVKTEKAISSLNRILPNINGPRTSKRRLLANTANSITLYAAPVWAHLMHYEIYKNILEKVQRKMLIKVTSAYRTAPTKALQVIARATPLHLLAMERKRMRKTLKEKITIKLNTREAWEKEWLKNVETSQWTKRLIPDISR